MSVVVGIPTYRRPALLQRLLRQVVDQARDPRSGVVAVVVADNACQPEAAEVVAEVASDTDLPIHYRPVSERGISQARNALVRGAYEAAPDWRYLVMYDDDGILTEGCLTALVDAADRYDADCVSGPVDMGALPPRYHLVRAYLRLSLPMRATGVVDNLNGGQNLLLARRLTDRMPDPWFLPQRGLSGGEDYAFLLSAREAGAVFAWSGDAVVREPLPPERLTRAAVMRRALEENAINVHTEVDRVGYRRAATHVLQTVPMVARDAAVGLVRRDADRLAMAAVAGLGLVGRASGLVGLDPQPYL